jgi:hypothetical protein
MRYLPELFCFEVKPNSIYGKMDYISLLVKASILNGYAEGTSNVSRKIVGRAPTGDTVLSYFKTMDRYELLSVSSIVFEWQIDELKRQGLLRRSVPMVVRRLQSGCPDIPQETETLPRSHDSF